MSHCSYKNAHKPRAIVYLAWQTNGYWLCVRGLDCYLLEYIEPTPAPHCQGHRQKKPTSVHVLLNYILWRYPWRTDWYIAPSINGRITVASITLKRLQYTVVSNGMSSLGLWQMCLTGGLIFVGDFVVTCIKNIRPAEIIANDTSLLKKGACLSI